MPWRRARAIDQARRRALPVQLWLGRRSHDLEARGTACVDAGTSGGVWGLERGFSEMIGGPADFVRHLEPEEFAAGTSPLSSALDPANFVPARFFGRPNPVPAEFTPLFAISVLGDGYDGTQFPATVGPNGTYFTRSLSPRPFTLETVSRSPLNLLEQRMGLSPTPGAAELSIDLSRGRVDLATIDSDMALIRDQESQLLPAIAGVNPASAEIEIEPTIFYAYGTNYGDLWVGGLTSPQPGGGYLIQLARFYIAFDSQGNMRVTNWEDYLVDEATNFYVLSIGRSDLARVTLPAPRPRR